MALTPAQIQKNKRDKKKAENERLGIVERVMPISKGLDDTLKRLMREHGIKQWPEVFANLLLNAAAADHAAAAKMLAPITTQYVIRPNVSRTFREESLKELRRDPGDEHIAPN